MKIALSSAVALLAIACGGSYPPPSDRLASSEAAVRSARELGAESDPKAQLHLKLADDEVARARKLMRDGENKRADLALQRASADAELAVVITRERTAKMEADKMRSAVESAKAKTSESGK